MFCKIWSLLNTPKKNHQEEVKMFCFQNAKALIFFKKILFWNNIEVHDKQSFSAKLNLYFINKNFKIVGFHFKAE